MIQLTDRQKSLFAFIKEQHGDQIRKYNGEPYWTHLLSVANIVHTYTDAAGLTEIALCHDLLEDTACTGSELEQKLSGLGYSPEEQDTILKGTIALTDVYTKTAYPELNREARKKLETQRLLTTGPDSQTVKYADIIDNLSSIVTYDKGFARVFIREYLAAIPALNQGDQALYERCSARLNELAAQLEIRKK